jgi:hypothetical protein
VAGIVVAVDTAAVDMVVVATGPAVVDIACFAAAAGMACMVLDSIDLAVVYMVAAHSLVVVVAHSLAVVALVEAAAYTISFNPHSMIAKALKIYRYEFYL